MAVSQGWAKIVKFFNEEHSITKVKLKGLDHSSRISSSDWSGIQNSVFWVLVLEAICKGWANVEQGVSSFSHPKFASSKFHRSFSMLHIRDKMKKSHVQLVFNPSMELSKKPEIQIPDQSLGSAQLAEHQQLPWLRHKVLVRNTIHYQA